MGSVYAAGDLCNISPCGHTFHMVCVDTLAAFLPDNGCPNCNGDITTTIRSPASRPSNRNLPLSITQIAGVVTVQADCKVDGEFIDSVRAEYSVTLLSGTTSRPHPKLRTLRAIEENFVYDLFPNDALVHDVGGNSNRHQKLGRGNVWSTRPNLIPGDSQRLRGAAGQFCSHKGQECQCKVFTHAMFIHSLYYLEKADIATVLNRTTTGEGYAVVHVFPGDFGNLTDEATYQRDANNKERVVMNVRGNTAPYSHNALDWIGTDGASFPSIHGVVTITRLFTFKYAVVLRLSISARGIANDLDEVVPSFAEIITSLDSKMDIRGPFARDPIILSALDSYKVKSAVVTVAGYDFYTSTSIISVPRSLIAHLTLKLADKSKDVHGYRMAVSYAMKEIPSYNLHPSQTAAVVNFAAALAFAEAARNEAAALTNLGSLLKARTWMEWLFQPDTLTRISQVKNDVFTSKPAFDIRYVAGGIIVAPFALYAAYRGLLFGLKMADFANEVANRFKMPFPPPPTFSRSMTAVVASRSVPGMSNPFHAILAGLGLSIAALPWPRVRKWVTDFLSSVRNSGLWIVGARRQGPHSFPLVTPLPFNSGPALPAYRADVCMEGRELKPIAPYASFKGPKETPDCSPRFGNQLHGFGLACAAPVVARSCHHNMTVALVNRGLIPTTHNDKEWKTYLFWLRRHMHRIFPRLEKIEYVYEEWRDRFPKPRQVMLDKAKQEVRNGFYPQFADGRASVFVKKENQIKAFPTGIALFDCRLIQAQTDRHQIITGEWTYVVSKLLSKQWGPMLGGEHVSIKDVSSFDLRDVEWNFIVYASGMTAAQIGAWFHFALQAQRPYSIIVGGDDVFIVLILNAKVYIMWMDAVRHDAHCHLDFHAQRMAFHLYEGLRDPVIIKALETESHPRGGSRMGHRFKTEGTTQSGVSGTSVSNSKGVGTHVAYALDKHLASARGPQDLLKMVLSTIEDLGFPQEGGCSDDLTQGDFFSAWFVPYGETGLFRLTPKPFRLLAKLFYSTTAYSPEHGAEWLRGVALGMRPAVHHIPVISEVIEHILLLTGDKRSKHYRVSEVYINLDPIPRNRTSDQWFMEKYNLNCLEITDMIREVQSATELPYVLGHPGFKIGLEVDLGEELPMPEGVSVCFNLFGEAVRLRIEKFFKDLKFFAIPLLTVLLTNLGFGLALVTLAPPPSDAAATEAFYIKFIHLFSTFAVAIQAPVVEEAAKRIPVFGTLFTIWLGISEARANNMDLIQTIGRVTLHTAMGALPAPLGLTAHFLLNFGCLSGFWIMLGRTSPVWWGLLKVMSILVEVPDAPVAPASSWFGRLWG